MAEGKTSQPPHHADQVAMVAAQPGKSVAAVLGEIVWLMSRDTEHRHVTVGQLENLVMPAILLRQFRLFYEKGQPVAVVLYARASTAVTERFCGGQTDLASSDWHSGDEEIVIRTIAPFGGHASFELQTLNLLNK